ncbi:hypothetical protein M1446_02890 [Candidatus Dependentiae bacterium]|nr:hypothetical protein [Candidatus Dependentiae bacterium]
MNFKLKILGIIALLSVTYFMAKNTVKKSFSNKLTQYETLAEEGQLAFGIPREKRVKVVKMVPSDPLYKNSAYYSAEDNKIFINEEMLNKVPYGCKRSIMFHECVHIKYGDTRATPQCEHRADTEGFYATECYICAHEIAVNRRGRDARNRGYLMTKDIDKISEDLKKQNKICSYHQTNKLNLA